MADHRLCSCCRRWCCTACSSSTRSCRAPATACTTGTGSNRSTTSSGSTTSGGRSTIAVFRDALAPQRRSSSCSRSRSRSPSRSAWPCCSTTNSRGGPVCARCSSRRTCCPRSSPASCGARSCDPTACSTRSSTASAPAGSSRSGSPTPNVVLYSLFFVISWKYFGFHMILLLAGLQQIPQGTRRGGRDRRRVGVAAFRHVTLPLLGPTLRVSIFLSIIGALQLFDLVWVTTKGGPIGASSTMATYLYDQFRKGLFGYASAVSIVIFALSLLVALLYQRFALRTRPARDWSRWLTHRSCAARALGPPHAARRSAARPGSTWSRSSCSGRDHRAALVLGARRLPHQPAARRTTRSACPTRGCFSNYTAILRSARSGARSGTAR